MADNIEDGLLGEFYLSPREKELRDKFVDEYFADYSPYAACLRVGYLKEFAKEYAERLMEDPYVRRKITERQIARATDPKKEEEESKRRIRELLFLEANNRGPGSSHAARVSALTKLMSLYGMDAPAKTQTEMIHRGGVMMVPAIANLEEWEKAATESQEQLVKDARLN